MKELAIVQRGSEALTTPSVPFDFPAGADALALMQELDARLRAVGKVHQFSKGMGIAAPQIGVNRSACVMISDGITYWMLNPKVIDQSQETDAQYEGCLSFFNVRGKVRSPLALTVSYCYTPNGANRITAFRNAGARLARHEIDHLNGILYTSRMDPGENVIPVGEYTGTGAAWNY